MKLNLQLLLPLLSSLLQVPEVHHHWPNRLDKHSLDFHFHVGLKVLEPNRPQKLRAKALRLHLPDVFVGHLLTQLDEGLPIRGTCQALLPPW